MFDQSSYRVTEQERVATIQLRKEGVNERDLSVVVMVDSADEVATGIEL